MLVSAGGAFFALDLALWNTSLLLTSATTATLLGNSAALWVGVASFFLLRRRMPFVFWFGLALSLAGMALLAGSGALCRLRFNTGDMLALGASIFYAAYLLITERTRSRVDILTFMAVSSLSSCLLLFVMSLFGGTSFTGFSGKTWACLIGLGLVSHLGGWLSINYALGLLRAAPVSVTLLGQVVVTALLSMPLLGEYPGINQIAGGLLVLTGIYFANRKARDGRAAGEGAA
jgi:drug/metabolite transporter (DMT)-like permease